jgi:hypothetical protein
MKIFRLLLLLLLPFISTFAQQNTNNYSYVTVPSRFSFQKDRDQYQLNALLKFLMDKEGYASFLDIERIPKKYLEMDCDGLRLKYVEKSSLLKSKLTLEMYDCNNALIYRSPQAVSFEKDYKKAYQSLVRETFAFLKEEGCIRKPGDSISKTSNKIAEVSEVENTIEEVAIGGDIYTNAAALSIRLQPKGEAFLGYISDSPSIAYNKGELVCKLLKTSLENVFKISWKDTYGNFIPTIGYFDALGNLKIDLDTLNGVKVMVFKK